MAVLKALLSLGKPHADMVQKTELQIDSASGVLNFLEVV